MINSLLRKIKNLIKLILDILCVTGAFCLGWCSFSKMKSYIHERVRYVYWWKLNKKGRLNVKVYNGKKIHDLDEANRIIGEAIEKGEPFMAGRYGSVELNAVWRVRDDGKGFIAPISGALQMMWHSAGFFPKDKNMMIKFAEIMRIATYQVNIMGVWFNPLEEWMLRTYGNNPEYCLLHGLDPLLSDAPWSAKLEGKNVLVIHPFKNTIESQYKKRELLFPGKNVLPEFNLRVVKAVQTIVGTKDERFHDWFEALDYMYNEAMKEDFDVAIIGCGAYGFPLAAKIKEAGKIALHLGAVTQLLFGIKGRRWETEYHNGYEKIVLNPAWVRPGEEEKPKGFETHEGGAYW